MLSAKQQRVTSCRISCAFEGILHHAQCHVDFCESELDIKDAVVLSNCGCKVEGLLINRKGRAGVSSLLQEYSQLGTKCYKIRIHVPKLVLRIRIQLSRVIHLLEPKNMMLSPAEALLPLFSLDPYPCDDERENESIVHKIAKNKTPTDKAAPSCTWHLTL